MWSVSVVVTVYPSGVSKSVTIELFVVFMVVSGGNMEDSATTGMAPVLLARSWLVLGIEDRWSIEVTSNEEGSVVSGAFTDIDGCWLEEVEPKADVSTCLLVVYSNVDAESPATPLEEYDGRDVSVVIGILVNNVDGLIDTARVDVVIVELDSETVGAVVIAVLVITGADDDGVDNLTVEVGTLWIILESSWVKNDPLVWVIVDWILDDWIFVTLVSMSVAVVSTEDESIVGIEVLSLLRRWIDDIVSLREPVEDVKDVEDEMSEVVVVYWFDVMWFVEILELPTVGAADDVKWSVVLPTDAVDNSFISAAEVCVTCDDASEI